MKKNLRVAFVSAEVAPYAKLGEMAEVAHSLPKHLAAQGMEVSLFMPKYRKPEIESLPKDRVLSSLAVPVGDRKVKAQVYRGEQGKTDLYLIDHPKYFWRDHIYGTGTGEYLDNDERFIFFNRAVLEFMLQSGFRPDIIHCNNWPTALIPVFCRMLYGNRRFFKNTATLLTLHNVAYQGEFPPDSLVLAGLNIQGIDPWRFSLNGKFNFLKTGILYADALNTVSSSYRKALLTRKHGSGLEEVIRKKRDVFFSIRNGIDYEVWNPETDPYIAANYSPENLSGKKACREDLLREFGLSVPETTPVVGLISYLRAHKGLDILLEAVEYLAKMDLALIVLGLGEERYEKKLIEAQRKYPQAVAVRLELNDVLAHKVAAGADLFLIPSLYEPCGLNQLYSFRYAAVPVVRATGGLAETVKPYDPRTGRGNGFVFREYSASALIRALEEATACFRKPRLWRKLAAAGMRQKYSWETAARRYVQLYRKCLEIKRGGKVA